MVESVKAKRPSANASKPRPPIPVPCPDCGVTLNLRGTHTVSRHPHSNRIDSIGPGVRCPICHCKFTYVSGVPFALGPDAQSKDAARLDAPKGVDELTQSDQVNKRPKNWPASVPRKRVSKFSYYTDLQAITRAINEEVAPGRWDAMPLNSKKPDLVDYINGAVEYVEGTTGE